jgi:hypothetical protein
MCRESEVKSTIFNFVCPSLKQMMAEDISAWSHLLAPSFTYLSVLLAVYFVIYHIDSVDCVEAKPFNF